MWQCYLSQSEKNVHSEHWLFIRRISIDTIPVIMNDVTLPLFLQKFLRSIFSPQKLVFLITILFRKTSLLKCWPTQKISSVGQLKAQKKLHPIVRMNKLSHWASNCKAHLPKGQGSSQVIVSFAGVFRLVMQQRCVMSLEMAVKKTSQVTLHLKT